MSTVCKTYRNDFSGLFWFGSAYLDFAYLDSAYLAQKIKSENGYST